MKGVRLRRAAGGVAAVLAVTMGGAALFSVVQAARVAAAYPPRGTFLGPAGHRIHLLERAPAGPARGTILLLHGASGNANDLMVPLGDRLAAEGFRVLAPDRPGHGWSDRPDGPGDASPARQAVLIRDALASLGVRHAIVVGHSWSGALAVRFALDAPDFTDGLVLLAPVTHPWPGGIAWYYAWAASAATGPVFNRIVALPAAALALPAGIRLVFDPAPPPPDFSDRTALPLLLRPDAFAANAQDVAGLYAAVTEQAPRMTRIAAPTAIVTGDHDDVVLARIHSVGSHAAIMGSTLTVLPGVGHSPHWADPGAVVSAVLDVAGRAERAARPSPHT